MKEQTKMTAEKLIEMAERNIRLIFSERGEVLPMYHYVRGDGEHGMFVPPFEDKDMVVTFAKIMFEAERATAYVYINEAWALDAEDVTSMYERYGSLEHAPGRKEVVLLSAEDQNGMVQGVMEIIRPDGQQPYLGEIKIQLGGSFEGRMVGLLPAHQGSLQ